MAFDGLQKKTNNIERTELAWVKRADGRALPFRGDFEAVNQDYQFIVELDEQGEIIMRRVGLFVEALFAQSLAGRRLTSLFSEPHRVIFDDELRALFNEPAKVFVEAITTNEMIEIALFPVSADYGPVNYAIGAVSLNQIPESSVLNLGIRNVRKEPLFEAEQELRYGFAEGPAGFSGAPKSPRFSVIEGGGEGGPSGCPGLSVVHNAKREP